MGENLAAEGRLAVRTPMQWTRRTQRRVLHRRPARPRRRRRRGRASGPSTSTSRPAARPGLAAGLDAAAHRALPRVPRAGLGRVQGAGPGAEAARAGASLRRGRRDGAGGTQHGRYRGGRAGWRSTAWAAGSSRMRWCSAASPSPWTRTGAPRSSWSRTVSGGCARRPEPARGPDRRSEEPMSESTDPTTTGIDPTVTPSGPGCVECEDGRRLVGAPAPLRAVRPRGVLRLARRPSTPPPTPRAPDTRSSAATSPARTGSGTTGSRPRAPGRRWPSRGTARSTSRRPARPVGCRLTGVSRSTDSTRPRTGPGRRENRRMTLAGDVDAAAARLLRRGHDHAAATQRAAVRGHRRERLAQAGGPAGRPLVQAAGGVQPAGPARPGGAGRRGGLRQRRQPRPGRRVRLPAAGRPGPGVRAEHHAAAEAGAHPGPRRRGRSSWSWAATRYDDAAVAAAADALRTGATMVPAFDDLRTIAGQGTVGVEIVAQLGRPPEVRHAPGRRRRTARRGGQLAGRATPGGPRGRGRAGRRGEHGRGPGQRRSGRAVRAGHLRGWCRGASGG